MISVVRSSGVAFLLELQAVSDSPEMRIIIPKYFRVRVLKLVVMVVLLFMSISYISNMIPIVGRTVPLKERKSSGLIKISARIICDKD